MAQALEASAGAPETPLAGATVGDARALEAADAGADAVLLLGPLYHLVERADRLRALREAHRVLRPGGVVLAAAISRFASTIDGLAKEALADPLFETMVEGDLRDGRHVNPDPAGRPNWFTTAYFHRPEDLGAEVEAAGFALEALVGDRERRHAPSRRRRVAGRPCAPRTAHAGDHARRGRTRTARCESPPARRRPRSDPFPPAPPGAPEWRRSEPRVFNAFNGGLRAFYRRAAHRRRPRRSCLRVVRVHACSVRILL